MTGIFSLSILPQPNGLNKVTLTVNEGKIFSGKIYFDELVPKLNRVPFVRSLLKKFTMEYNGEIYRLEHATDLAHQRELSASWSDL